MRILFRKFIDIEKGNKKYNWYTRMKEDLELLNILSLREKINEESERRKLNFELEDYGIVTSWLFLAFPPKRGDIIEIDNKKCIQSRIHEIVFMEVTLNDLICKVESDISEQKLIQKIVSTFYHTGKICPIDYSIKKLIGKIINLDLSWIDEIRKISDRDFMDPEVYNYAATVGLREDRSYIRHLYCQKMMANLAIFELIYNKL